MELEEQAQGSRNRHKGWNLRNRREGQSYVYPVRPCRMPVLYARTVCPCSMPVLYVCALCLWSMFVEYVCGVCLCHLARIQACTQSGGITPRGGITPCLLWGHHSLSSYSSNVPPSLLQRASVSASVSASTFLADTDTKTDTDTDTATETDINVRPSIGKRGRCC